MNTQIGFPSIDFESGEWKGTGYQAKTHGTDTPPQIVFAWNGYPVKSGSKSMRSAIEYPFFRSEIEPIRWCFKFWQYYQISFGVYIPSEWVIDNAGINDTDIIFQARATHDMGEQGSRSPVLSIAVDGDGWRLGVRFDSRNPDPPGNDWEGQEHYHIDGLDKGRWVDWKILVRWAYDGSGVLKIWKGNEMVLDRPGPNCAHDKFGPSFSFGLYKWVWSDVATPVTNRVLYHDDFRVKLIDENDKACCHNCQ